MQKQEGDQEGGQMANVERFEESNIRPTDWCQNVQCLRPESH